MSFALIAVVEVKPGIWRVRPNAKFAVDVSVREKPLTPLPCWSFTLKVTTGLPSVGCSTFVIVMDMSSKDFSSIVNAAKLTVVAPPAPASPAGP